MNTQIKFLAIVMIFLVISCKKKTVAPDPYAFLKGTWQYLNGAECVFDATSKSAKGTKVPTNNIFKFVEGELYWKNVVSTGTDQWEYDQIIRYENGSLPMEYRKSTMKKKDENTLSTSIPRLGEGEFKRVTK